MQANALTDRLNSEAAVARHLNALLARDPRLRAVNERAGPFPPRSAPRGFVGLAKIICGQQLSVASANAIWSRFEALPGALDPQTYLGLDESTVRATGFSAGKYRTVRVIAEAVVSGELDFTLVEGLAAEEAVAYLTAHKGIGPWTAEIYLMFCAGHPDVFPAGDLALQKAVGHAFGLDASPSVKQLVSMALDWSPHRATAALLFWRYYAAIRDREGIIL
ncbi:DNA-3-methyladenine glycosylase family protein [Devosia nitrariae]|uniref:DNA-3-methyladenine glycosylase II n=1 Tax=Devosia nitrariae TaxID=2071872 RepID=A0ABQ5W280_9HYPH|nr:DNA-3-methyladenine glycosylase [Devosia nitrariae]GLQ54185.1 DNA-3-methyladenine glycosidase [Devosia nitrariae]